MSGREEKEKGIEDRRKNEEKERHERKESVFQRTLRSNNAFPPPITEWKISREQTSQNNFRQLKLGFTDTLVHLSARNA